MSERVIATFEAPITDQKPWVARLTRLDPKWGFGRDQLAPVSFDSRIVFFVQKPGLYEHRNTSHGSGFVYIGSDGISEALSRSEAIAMLE